MKILKIVDKGIAFLEKGPVTIKTIFISFIAIVATRYLVENILFGFKTYDFAFLLGSMIQGTFLFFLMAYVAVLTFLILFIKEKPSKLATVLLWGQWIIVLPPIIDKIIFGEKDFWSFYIFDSIQGLFSRFFHFFGDNPSFGITYGTRVEIFLAMLGIGLYIGFKKRSWIKGLTGFLIMYIILYFFAVFPSLLTFLIEGFLGEDIFKIKSSDIAATFLTSLEIFDFDKKSMKIALHFRASLFYTLFLFGNLLFLQFILNKNKFFALLRNVRYPQMFFNGGLFFVGLAMGCFYFPANISKDIFAIMTIVNLIISISSAWFYSVLINDIEDTEIDKITNKERPLIRDVFTVSEYKNYAAVFMGLSLLTALVAGIKFFLIICVYLLATWVYSCRPMRLRRVLVISSFISAAASMLFLFMGFIVVSNGQSLESFPWKIGVFLFIVYTLLIPIKDIKDIKGDKKNGVVTIPTLFGEDNSRFIFSVIIFISYLESIFILNENKLWLSATLFGALNYWILNNKKIKTRNLNGWILGTVFVYGMLLVVISFF